MAGDEDALLGEDGLGDGPPYSEEEEERFAAEPAEHYQRGCSLREGGGVGCPCSPTSPHPQETTGILSGGWGVGGVSKPNGSASSLVCGTPALPYCRRCQFWEIFEGVRSRFGGVWVVCGLVS